MGVLSAVLISSVGAASKKREGRESSSPWPSGASGVVGGGCGLGTGSAGGFSGVLALSFSVKNVFPLDVK